MGVGQLGDLGIENWEELKLEEGKEWKRKELRIRRFAIRMRENIGYDTY